MSLAVIKQPSVVGSEVIIADGTTVWYFTQIVGDVVIGSDCIIGSHNNIIGIGQSVRIGNNVRTQSGVFIPGGTIIEDNVFLGPGVQILNDKYPPCSTPDLWSPVTIKEGAIIGGGAILTPGVVIGKGAKVAAGAVVVRNVKDGAVVLGHPAISTNLTRWN